MQGYLYKNYDLPPRHGWIHWVRDRSADYIRKQEHLAPYAKGALSSYVRLRNNFINMKRSRNEVGDPEHKHGHSARFEDGTNHEGVRNKYGVVYVEDNSNVITTARRGCHWISEWKDPRETLHRLLLPPIYAAAGRTETQLTTTAGKQDVTGYTWGTNAHLKSMIASMAPSVSDTSGYAPFYGANYTPNQQYTNTGSDMTNCYIPMCQKQWVFHNSCEANVTLELLDFECINDTSTTPLTIWSNLYNTNNIQPSGVAGNAAADTLAYQLIASGGTAGDGAFNVFNVDKSFNMSANTLGERPFKAKMLHKYWKCVDKVQASIPPGRSVEYTLELTRKKVTNYELNQAGTYVKGFSRYLMVIYHGQLDSAIASSTNLTVSNAALTVRSQAQYAVYNFLNIPTRKWTAGLAADGDDSNNWYPTVGTLGNNKVVNQDTDAVLTGDNNYA